MRILYEISSQQVDWEIRHDYSGLMEHWIHNRPKSTGLQPRVIDASILELRAPALYANANLKRIKLFKGLQPSMFARGNAVGVSIQTDLISPAGYYSSDVLRSLMFVAGPTSGAHVGTIGWLLLCTQPQDAKPLDNQISYPHDKIYGSAQVAALVKVRIDKTS